ncbi:MAG: GrpB family protein [Bacteroidota bacterium]|nr:GrpB family protein [Bacteroidota bacterium]
MKIELSEYNSNWTDLFLKEKQILENVLPFQSLIEHIGSTSIKDLCAKPGIDILCGVEHFSFSKDLIDKIVELNYEYVEEYNKIIPERLYFRKNGEQRFHIHLVQIGGEFWERHVSFRDFLRKNENAKNEYALLKRQLAQKDWLNGNEYAAAKTDFIKAIEVRAKDY